MAKYKVDDMVKALNANRGMVYVAARALGCSPVTIYTYAKKHPAVQEAIDNHRGLLVDEAEIALARAVLRGESWAVSLALKTLGKARGYVERQEVTGADGGPLQHEVNTIDAEIERKLAAISAPGSAGPVQGKPDA